MATNIEIKADIQNYEVILERVRQIGDGPGAEIEQEDIFFNTPHGRLKLRILGPDVGQLIYYERADHLGPKPSEYYITNTEDPQGLRHVLESGLGVRGVVRKKRALFFIGQTRIHLDQVEGLGEFLELEVVLGAGQTSEAGVAIANELMHRLGVSETDLVQGAYIDLMEKGYYPEGK
jgi:predicted adenylyl cyclase CyaB